MDNILAALLVVNNLAWAAVLWSFHRKNVDALSLRVSSPCSCSAGSGSVSATAPDALPATTPSPGVYHPTADDLQAAESARMFRLREDTFNPYGVTV